MSGQTFYQNIILYEPSIKADIQDLAAARKELMEIGQQLQSIPIENIKRQLGSGPDWNRIFIVHAMKALFDRQRIESLPDAVRNRIVIHETSHMSDVMTSAHGDMFLHRGDEGAHEYIAKFFNGQVNEEIGALLTELAYATDRAEAFAHLYGYLLEKDKQTLAYSVGAEWIMDAFCIEILKNSAAYGMSVQENGVVTPREQIVLAIPQLLDKPKELEKLLKLVHDAHYASLSKEIGRASC